MMDTRWRTRRLRLALLAGLLPGLPVLADGREAEAPTVPPYSLAAQLGDALTERGWTFVHGPDGSLHYYPPAQTRESAVGARRTLAERLRRQLESLGWVAEPAEDGGVYYRPPEVQPAPRSTLADQLRGQLARRGWTASTAEDGSTIYSRPRVSSPAVDPDAGAGALARQLRKTLEARGWTGAPAADGSVYYRRPAPGERAGPPAAGPPATPGQAVDSGSVAEREGESIQAAPDPVSPPEAPESKEVYELGDRPTAGPQVPAHAATAGGASAAGVSPRHPRRQAWYPGYPPPWLPPQGWRHMPQPAAPVWRPGPWGAPAALPYPHRWNAIDR